MFGIKLVSFYFSSELPAPKNALEYFAVQNNLRLYQIYPIISFCYSEHNNVRHQLLSF